MEEYKKFASYGKNLDFKPWNSSFTYHNILIGNHVSIGDEADFIATRSKIKIGNHVVFAPRVEMRGGVLRIVIVGLYMDTFTYDENCLKMMPI